MVEAVELGHAVVVDRSTRYVSFFFYLFLLKSFRANATFTYLADEVRAGLNDAEFARVKTALTQLVPVAIEVSLLGVAMRWSETMVSFPFFLS